MEASSPLSSAPSGFDEDDGYRNGTSPVSLVKTPTYHIGARSSEIAPPRPEPSLPEIQVFSGAASPQMTAQVLEPTPEATREKQAAARDGPAVNGSSSAAELQLPVETASIPAGAENEPELPSFTANTFALALPSTPQQTLSAAPEPEQQQEMIPSIPETPQTPTSSQTPPKKSPGSRGRPSKKSTPAAPAAPSTPQRSVTDDVASSTSPAAANGAKAASRVSEDAGSANRANDGARTTTRSGRRVKQPKNVLQDVTPPPPSAKASKMLGKSGTAVSAAARAATSAVGDAISPTVTATVKRRRKAEAARWKTDFLLSDSRSPLAQFDLRSILLRPETWDALSAEEKTEVLSLFPSMENVANAGTDAARPNGASLMNDNNFRHDCARYQNDLADGFFEREWLAEAFEAHAMRHGGMFSEYVIHEFEHDWGVRVPDSLRHSLKEKAEEEKLETGMGAEPTFLTQPGSCADMDNSLGEKPASLKRCRQSLAEDEPAGGAEARDGDGENGMADEEAAPSMASTPTPKRKKAAVTKPSPRASAERGDEGQAANDATGEGTTAQAVDADAAADAATAPAPAPAGPTEILSLRLGSPIVDDEKEEGAEKPASARAKTGKAASPRTKKAPAKRKAATTPTRSRRKRRSPNVEVGEDEKNGTDDKDGQD